MLRILTDDSASVCRLGLKFGAPIASVPHLVRTAKALGVRVIGISYHVGSGNGKAESFATAVADARLAFDAAAAAGTPLRLLDIGGGFPGSTHGDAAGAVNARPATDAYASAPSFGAIAAAISGALETHFPASSGVELIAEPGRFFVRSSHALAVSVIGKRVTADEAGSGGSRYNYYVNDGLYGSFNCLVYDHAAAAPPLLLTAVAEATTAADEVADDAIAKLDAFGLPVATDAVGLGYAADLREAVTVPLAAAVAAAARSRVRRVVRNGGAVAVTEDEDDSGGAHDAVTAALSSNGGASGGRGALFASTPVRGGSGAPSSASSAASSTTAPITGSPRRRFSYAAPTAGGAAAAAAVAAAPGSSVFPATIWGPTCDSFDKISDTIALPELPLGAWLVFENMGAYTIAGSCRFNGFPLTPKVYLNVDGTMDVSAPCSDE